MLMYRRVNRPHFMGVSFLWLPFQVLKPANVLYLFFVVSLSSNCWVSNQVGFRPRNNPLQIPFVCLCYGRKSSGSFPPGLSLGVKHGTLPA